MRPGRIIMAALYVAAGVGHLVATRLYQSIMPDYLPEHRGLVLLSGGLEICGGIGLLVPQTRRLSAYGIVAMLIVYFTVHVWMIQHHADRYRSIPLWALLLRIPLQFVLIGWALKYAGKRGTLTASFQ